MGSNQYTGSQYSSYDNQIAAIFENNPGISILQVCKILSDKYGFKVHGIREYISRTFKKSKKIFNTSTITIDTTEPLPFIPREVIKNRHTDALVRQLREDKEILIKEYDELLKAHEIALALKEYTNTNIPVITLNSNSKNQGIPLIQYSDWHVEEKVEKSTTLGLNEFNPDIARKRVKKLTENTLKLIRKERQDIDIKKLFINLGGDFINSYLHEHDVQMNYMSPLEAIVYAKELLKESLLTLIEYGEFLQVDIMCDRGNHPRLTHRMQSSNDYKMNLEAMLYNMLKQEISDSSINWHIPESEFGYIKIGDKMIRTMHGHQIKFKGGLGGITIPLNKYIMRLDQTRQADYTCMSHWHTLNMINDCNTSISGSLVGFNSYSASLAMKYQPPMQVFQLLDMKRGFTTRIPIHCDS